MGCVARISLLLPLLLVFSYSPEYASVPRGPFAPVVFWLSLVCVVTLARLVAVGVARRSASANLADDSAFFHRMMSITRLLVLVWTGVGLYFLGWGPLVLRSLPTMIVQTTVLPAAMLIAMPSYLAWLALHWAQYPADLAHREQIMVHHLDLALPVRQPPTLWQYLDHHLRTGPGLLLLPILTVVILRDTVALGLRAAGVVPSVLLENGIALATMAGGFALFPVLLVRILRTTRLPEGPLRTRLEVQARRAGVRVAEVLVWNTGNSMANALVTGVIPRFRYVLISDFLLESMDDAHIEAVFAHELGHVVHRHLAWYPPFVLSLAVLSGWLEYPLGYLKSRLPGPGEYEWLSTLAGGALEMAVGLATLGGILLLWGMLSRRFERQADVFAARSLHATGGDVHTTEEAIHTTEAAAARAVGRETASVPPANTNPEAPLRASVEPFGAATFAEALKRVALLNNIPLTGRNFTHGSIQSRMNALRIIAENPLNTPGFDTRMLRVRVALSLTILAGVVSLFFVKF